MTRFHKHHNRDQSQAGSALLWLLVLASIAGLAVFFWYAGQEQVIPLPTPPTATKSQTAPKPATNSAQEFTPVHVLRKDSDTPLVKPRTLSKGDPLPAAVAQTNPPPSPLPAVTNAIRTPAPLSSTNITPVTPASNSAPKTVSTLSTNAPGYPRPARTILEAQIAMDRLGISSGSLDGVIGSQTRSAFRAFQKTAGLAPSGEWDLPTRGELLLNRPPLTSCELSTNDFAEIQPLSPSWLGKSQQSRLAFESVLESLAERSHAHPELIRHLNPGINWTNVTAGTTVQMPDASPAPPAIKAAWAVIRLGEKTLEAFDSATNLLLHFPCSIARYVEKRPLGELHVTAIALNPNYTFNPALFPESPEAQTITTKLILPPGPNNPVGAAWIGLDRPGYGMHGTPGPEQVGRTESHGCFRLANWNAELLARHSFLGMPVLVEP